MRQGLTIHIARFVDSMLAWVQTTGHQTPPKKNLSAPTTWYSLKHVKTKHNQLYNQLEFLVANKMIAFFGKNIYRHE